MSRPSSSVVARGSLTEKAGAETPADEVLHKLLEQLVGPGSHRAAPGGAQDQVVLEVDVDGMRYTLTRHYRQPEEIEANLSPREKEIARLVAKGLPNKAIAAVLEISQWTVSTHLRRIFAKLHVNSRAEMVARVLGEGLLEGHT